MKQMKTLTLPNGVTYEIVDEQARNNIAATAEEVLAVIPKLASGGSFVKSDSIITATLPLDDGTNTENIITLDENGFPTKIVTDGIERTFTWEGF